MGNKVSRESGATVGSNEASPCQGREQARTCAETFQRKKKITKVAGGAASGVAIGTGLTAAGAAGTAAVVGTVASIAVGISTLGVGALVGFIATGATVSVMMTS